MKDKQFYDQLSVSVNDFATGVQRDLQPVYKISVIVDRKSAQSLATFLACTEGAMAVKMNRLFAVALVAGQLSACSTWNKLNDTEKGVVIGIGSGGAAGVRW